MWQCHWASGYMHSAGVWCLDLQGQAVPEDGMTLMMMMMMMTKWPCLTHTGTFQKFLLVIAENKISVGFQVHSNDTMLIPSHVQTCHLVSQTNWGDLFISSLERKMSKWNFILITNCHSTSATYKQCKHTLHWKPEQFTSSELSPQSSSRSQRHRLGIHLLLAQRNSDSEHSR
jgi:hypothetical protein